MSRQKQKKEEKDDEEKDEDKVTCEKPMSRVNGDIYS